MKTLHCLLSLCLVSASPAEPPTPKDALADALYTEEVTRDPNAAASQYLCIVEAYRSQRAHAATALFRLAEIRRAQNRKDETIGLYQEFLTSFSDFQPQAKLAREHLAALGAPAAVPATDDLERKEIARLTKLLKTAPDLIIDPSELERAARNNRLLVIDFLLANGSSPWKSDALESAASWGYLEAAKKLIEHDPKVPADIAFEAVWDAYSQGHDILLTYLLEQGFPTEPSDKDRPSLFIAACAKNDRTMVDDLLTRGSEINRTITGRDQVLLQGSKKTLLFSPLHTAIHGGHIELALHLLDKGASPALQGTLEAGNARQENIQPLHLAASSRTDKAPDLIKALLAAGADLSAKINGDQLRAAPSLPEGTALDIAIILGLAENAKVLLDAGASAKPLDLEAALDSLPLFEALLKAGVDPNAGIEWSGKEGPTLPIFKSICQNFPGKLTARHIDLMLKHGAKLDPRWVMEKIVPQRESEARSSILGHFDKNADYKYLSNCTIRAIPQWQDQQDGDLPAVPAATEIAEEDAQIFITPIRGTDLLKISCYDASPAQAQARAKAFLAKMTQWQADRLKKLTATEDPAPGVKPTAEKVGESGKFWVLFEAPQLPKEKITWK